MHNLPTEHGELRRLYAINPVVGLAEQALRAFYVSARVDAARLLPLWRHYGELSDVDRAAVLARFDDTRDDRDNPETGVPLPAGVEGYTPGGAR